MRTATGGGKTNLGKEKKQLGSHNSSIIIVYYLALRNNCKKLAEIYAKPHISCSKLAISAYLLLMKSNRHKTFNIVAIGHI